MRLLKLLVAAAAFVGAVVADDPATGAAAPPVEAPPVEAPPVEAPPETPATTTPVSYCGGLLGLQCPSAKQVCIYPFGTCGAADQAGTCTDVPDACITLYDPVCGCDGQTYGNACFATIAGVSVVSKGECKPPCEDPDTPSAFCGGIAGFQCKRKRYFCEFAPGDCLNVADAGGKCVKRPDRCLFLYKPVCGCNGKTYANQCWARASGQSVACDGECPCPRARVSPPPLTPAPLTRPKP